jgi:hypothetical protein
VTPLATYFIANLGAIALWAPRAPGENEPEDTEDQRNRYEVRVAAVNHDGVLHALVVPDCRRG